MKFSSSISTLSVILPLIAQVHALSVQGGHHVARAQQNQNFNKFGGFNNKGNQGNNNNKGAANNNKGGANNNNNNKGGNNNNQATSAVVSGTNAVTATNTGAAASSTSAASSSSSNNNSNDPQSSLTLDPNVIATGFEQNGQEDPTAGQIASLTSTNNFINFCLTVPNLPITNGQQITTGSCNPAPIGVIPSTDNMPSAKFVDPPNFGTIAANTAFTVTLNTANIELGNFVNAKTNYFAAPQTLNGQGQIIGHTHVVIEQLPSLTSTTPTSPGDFAFFKGVDDAGTNGQVQVPVSAGVPPGAYRMCTINTSANHAPAIVPVAQHGALDDCTYFTASVNGQAASNSSSSAASNTGAANNNNAGSAAASNAGSAANNAGSAASNAGSAASNAGSAANNNGNANKNTGAAANNNGNANKNTGAAANNNGNANKNTGAANNNNANKNTGNANNNAKNSQASQAAQAAAANQAAQAAAQKAAQSKQQQSQNNAQNQKGKAKRGFMLNGRSGLRPTHH